MSTANTADDDELVREADGAEEAWRKRQPVLFWGTLIGPPVSVLLVLAIAAALHGLGFAQKLLATGLVTAFALGRLVILGGETERVDPSFFSPGQLVLMLIYLDIMTASVIVFHFGAVFRLPWIGPRLRGFVDGANLVLSASPWMRRGAFLATVLFVTVPLAATGSVGGAILGRLLGLRPRVSFVAVVLGSLSGCTLVFVSREAVGALIASNDPILKVAGVGIALVLVAGLLWLNLRMRRLKKKMASDASATRPDPPTA